MAFSHENLKVYNQALVFSAKVSAWTALWDSRHAVCDQFNRAADSIVENIAMASASYSIMKIRSLDYAMGSALECAACLDLAGIKRLQECRSVAAAKEDLSHILKMIFGLRRAWLSAPRHVREDSAEYAVKLEGVDKDPEEAPDTGWEGDANKVRQRILFHHEALDVYRVALEAATLFCNCETVGRLPIRVFRRLDELLTSMVLNIAEGNGRFAEADQRKFLETSHEAAVKMAAKLDLCFVQGTLPSEVVRPCKDLLERVAAMAAAMCDGGRR